MIKISTEFRCENIPSRFINRSMKMLKPSNNLSTKFNWIREMLNNSRDVSATIPDIIAKSSSLLNSRSKTKRHLPNKENQNTLNLTNKLNLNPIKKTKTLENEKRFLALDSFQSGRKFSCEMYKTKNKLRPYQRMHSREYLRKPVRDHAEKESENQGSGFKLDPWANDDLAVEEHDDFFNANN